jgi:hypothetical protein
MTVVAPRTLTCCPSIARTARAKPSSVPGDADAGEVGDGGHDARAHQMPRDHVGIGIEVEQVAQAREQRHERRDERRRDACDDEAVSRWAGSRCRAAPSPSFVALAQLHDDVSGDARRASDGKRHRVVGGERDGEHHGRGVSALANRLGPRSRARREEVEERTPVQRGAIVEGEDDLVGIGRCGGRTILRRERLM